MKKSGKTKIYLKAGEVYIAKTPAEVWTVLGSCVSIIFYSKKHKISAISHAQLPAPGNSEKACNHSCPKPCFQKEEEIASDLKYVSCSTKYMLDELRKIGVNSTDLVAYLIGGAKMFDLNSKVFAIGERNVELAREFIIGNKIKLIKEEVLGNQSRTITFDSENGHISLNKKIIN